MRKVVALLLLSSLAFSSDYEQIKTAYLTGWFDAFRIAYYMKNAKRVQVPSGWWVVYPLSNLPVEYVAFYVFAGLREGVKPMLTKDYVVFGVYERRADADFLAEKLRTKDVEAEVVWRGAEEGLLGMELSSVHAEPRFGIDAVLYHLTKAIEKAQDVDPSVFNRDLLVEDLQTIKREIEKWKGGRKGYTPSVVEKKEEPEKEKVREFVERKERREELRKIEEFLKKEER